MLSRQSAVLALVFAGAALAAGQSRPHVYDLKNVEWTVSLDPDHESITGDVTNTLVPLGALSEIVFDAGPQLQIDKLTVNGVKRLFHHEGDKLRIAIPERTKAGQSLAVRIVYHGQPDAGIYFVPASRAYPAHTPVTYTQGEMEDNRQWLPTYDYPDNKATSEGRIDVPADWTAVSNGKLLEVVNKGSRKIYHWKMDKPHSTYLISLTAGPMEEGMSNWDGIPVSFWVPVGLKDQGETSFGMTNKIVELYSKLTHYRYPYVKFTQDVVPDFMFGGMENITAVTQTISTLHPPDVEPLDNSSGLVAHELAHQWFGDTVTCHDWSHTWLNEGWASFMPSFWIRESEGQDAFDLSRYNTFQGGLSAHAGQNRPVVWTGYKDPIDMFNNFAYPGGASRMFMLMNILGEEKFWNAVSVYLHDKQFQNVTTEQFFAEMKKATGKDFSQFMTQWFYTPAAPKLTVNVNGSSLNVTQTAPYFDMDSEVWIFDQGAWVKKPLHLAGQTTTMDLGSMSGDPVLVDPQCQLMANVESRLKLSTLKLVELYKSGLNAGERARMMDTMLSGLEPAAVEQMARDEKFLDLKVRWIQRLGSGSSQYLLELLKDSDARIRDAAIGVLRNQGKSSQAMDALIGLAANDPNPSIRESAFSAVLWSTGDASLADKAFTMDGFRDRYRETALDWWVANKPDLGREKCLEYLNHPTAEPVRVNVIRSLGRLKDLKGERRVYQALLKVVNEHSFGARVAAIQALAEYGDKSAVPIIQPLTKNTLVFMRGAAIDAVAKLSGS